MEWTPTAQLLLREQVPYVGSGRAVEGLLPAVRKVGRSRLLKGGNAALAVACGIDFQRPRSIAFSSALRRKYPAGVARHFVIGCSEAGFAETVAGNSDGTGVDLFSDLSPVASSPTLPGSPDFFVDASLASAKSVDAKNELQGLLVPERVGEFEGITPPFGQIGESGVSEGSPTALYSSGTTRRHENLEPIPDKRRTASPDGISQEVDGRKSEDSKSIFDQIREIMVFAGPALGIWIAGPLMSIIDTAVVGRSSSLELAALGPGTVICDGFCYVFMFLSVATSNLIASSLARKDKAEAAGHLSRLLFVSFSFGLGMFAFTAIYSTSILKAFVGVKNAGLVEAAQSYVKIRGFAWPAVLVGMVAQSASLGMQDSWGPLRVLVIASLVNCFGDIVLCSFLGYGIAGAAWATMVSQYVGTFCMLRSVRGKGYNALSMSIPTMEEFVHMVGLAAPVLLTMFSKVSFYTLITYLATSLGSSTLAGHQVMIGIFSICTVWGEPLSQTAQSFMPALIEGAERNLKEARLLLKSLLIIGIMVGCSLGAVFTFVPWFVPHIFTKDLAVVAEMRKVTLPFWFATALTPPTLSCEGTLLAGRDLNFLGFSMASCFCGGSLLLLTMNKLGFGLQGSWWTLACFQLARFLQSYSRLNSQKSFLYEDAQTMSLKTA